MRIEKLSIETLIPYGPNPRVDLKPGDDKYVQIEASLNRFGLVDPPVVNIRTMHLLGGNQRIKILKALGHREVDVSVVDIPEDREAELNLALNNTNDWDEDKLEQVLRELSQKEDFSPEVSGFTWEEVTERTDPEPEDLGEDDFNEEEELENLGEPITKPGDIVQVGPHKLLNGDSGNLDDLQRFLGDERIDCCHQDVPYRVSYAGGQGSKPSGTKKGKWRPIKNDDLPPEQYQLWLKAVLETQRKFFKNGMPIYIWNGHANFGLMAQILEELGFHVSTPIVWVKPTACMSRADYFFGAEFAIYGWFVNVSEDAKAHPFYGPRGESTVWQISRDPTSKYEHPTQKPLEIARRVLRNSTRRNDLVFDGFCGSGFSLISCQQMGRVFRGIDQESAYIDICVRRYIRVFGPQSVSKEVLEKYGKKAGAK